MAFLRARAPSHRSWTVGPGRDAGCPLPASRVGEAGGGEGGGGEGGGGEGGGVGEGGGEGEVAGCPKEAKTLEVLGYRSRRKHAVATRFAGFRPKVKKVLVFLRARTLYNLSYSILLTII